MKGGKEGGQTAGGVGKSHKAGSEERPVGVQAEAEVEEGAGKGGEGAQEAREGGGKARQAEAEKQEEVTPKRRRDVPVAKDEASVKCQHQLCRLSLAEALIS